MDRATPYTCERGWNDSNGNFDGEGKRPPRPKSINQTNSEWMTAGAILRSSLERPWTARDLMGRQGGAQGGEGSLEGPLQRQHDVSQWSSPNRQQARRSGSRPTIETGRVCNLCVRAGGSEITEGKPHSINQGGKSKTQRRDSTCVHTLDTWMMDTAHVAQKLIASMSSSFRMGS